jgi:hypothetical protein
MGSVALPTYWTAAVWLQVGLIGTGDGIHVLRRLPAVRPCASAAALVSPERHAALFKQAQFRKEPLLLGRVRA